MNMNWNQATQIDQKQKMNSNQYFQFSISRYPFPHTSMSLQAKLYKTFYQCEGFQLTNEKLARFTGMNKLASLIKLKQIVKNVSRSKLSHFQDLHKVTTHNYSLHYEIVQHCILSPLGVFIIKSLSKNTKEHRQMFESLFQDIQTLISQRIYYTIDVQNMGITTSGQIKIYLPANYILEQTIFTDSHEYEMRMTANATIDYLKQNMEDFVSQKGQLDIDWVRQEIKRQVLNKICIIPKNIESQIFAFNEKSQNQQPNDEITPYNEDLQKTVKIGKSSQKIQFIPAIEFHLLKQSMPRDASKYRPRCMTSRQEIHKEEEGPRTKRQGEYRKDEISGFVDINPHKQNEFLKQRIKEYEQKLYSLNNTVKQMKQELMTIGKKKINSNKNANHSLQKYKNQQQNNHSKSFANLSQINESRQQNISLTAEKLFTSKLYIKKLLHDDTFLRKSYLLEEQDQEEDQINQKQQAILNRQIQNLMGSNNVEHISKRQFSQTKNNRIRQKAVTMHSTKNIQARNNQLQKDKRPQYSKEKINNKRPYSNLRDLKETSPLQINDSSELLKSKNRKSPNSCEYESSLGKYSPSGGNPFRQYGNFRIEYVIDEEQTSKKESPEKKYKMGGHIQIHRDPSPAPYRIVRSPVKKEHLFYPVVHIREPFRYSCLTIPKVSGDEYEYIAIPQNMYDPTEYDSVDTFEMELGFAKEYKMPTIVSKGAFRHTLLPSTFIEKMKTDERMKRKVSKEREEKPQKDSNYSESIKKQTISSNKIFESAEGKILAKYIQTSMAKQSEPNIPDDLYERKSNQRLSKIRQAPSAFHEISMDVDTLSNRNDSRLEKKRLEESSKLREIFEGARYNNYQSRKEYDIISRLSQAAKDVTKILKKGVSQQKDANNELRKVLSRGMIYQDKKLIDRQKLNAVLNKSKEIISRYKNIHQSRID